MKLEYMNEPVDENCLIKAHNITPTDLYELKLQNEKIGKFTIDGLEYKIIKPEILPKTERTYIKVKFTCNGKTGLSSSQVTNIVGMSRTWICTKTKKTGEAKLKGYLITREKK